MAEERAKHEKKAAEIRANLESQTKLLPAIVEANANFAPARDAMEELHEKQQKCETCFVVVTS